MKNYKRLFKFVKGRYRFFVVSLVMIVIIQILGLISPLIVKGILDEGILGIENTWCEVNQLSDNVVEYDNRYFKQQKDLKNSDEILGNISIVIFKTKYYFVNEQIEKGTKSIQQINGVEKLVISSKEGADIFYNIVQLNKTQIKSFYSPITKVIVILIFALLIKTILTIICTYIQHMCTNRVVSLIARDGRRAAIESCEFLKIADFEAEPAGKMASRITTDVDGMIALYRLTLNVFGTAFLSFIFAYVGMFYLNSKLALLSFVIYPFVAIWIFFFLKKMRKIATGVNESRSLLTAKINEIINGINILQVFNFRKQTINEFNDINSLYMNQQLKDIKLSMMFGWNLLNILKALITAGIVAFFGWQHLSVSGVIVTAGLIYAYNEYLLKIINPINILFTQVSEFQHAMVRTERIHKLIEGEREDDTMNSINRYAGNIIFDNVWFAYNKDDYVLKGVSFKIKEGELVGLVGHTGSGKSSLMNLLLRFYDITDSKSGNIYVDNVNINTWSKRSYREHIGIVLQEPTLFKGTIASNIRFGHQDISDKQIIDVLISLGGENLISKFPLGINQPITRSGVNMSSGEKQLIALARAIVHNPSILIMDEATSHIDTETEEIIKKALDIACKGRTVIVIAHRLSTIYNADKIIVLENGLKVEEGTHEQLVGNNHVYANIYRSQVAYREMATKKVI